MGGRGGAGRHKRGHLVNMGELYTQELRLCSKLRGEPETGEEVRGTGQGEGARAAQLRTLSKHGRVILTGIAPLFKAQEGT